MRKKKIKKKRETTEHCDKLNETTTENNKKTKCC